MRIAEFIKLNTYPLYQYNHLLHPRVYPIHNIYEDERACVNIIICSIDVINIKN